MNKYLESIAAISPDKQQSSPDELVGLKKPNYQMYMETSRNCFLLTEKVDSNAPGNTLA
ncbi:hypothetical protein H6G35_29830 [Aulosira sp. FACHB-113]|uniref:hypothetical protein n=1 Tax=Tolypothrix tenuis TaxID=457083 RepID=UPI001687F93C|nr:hypothetical protein [Aulosira sp. FACHB-113]